MNNWIDQCTLIGEESSGTNSNGFPLDPTETRTTVWCNAESVRASEFYQAQQQGITAVYSMQVNASEYAKQPRCEYDGALYNVFRTYLVKKDNIIELTLTEINT